MADYELDARRLLCPMPVIKTQNRVAQLNNGDTLQVACTDPGAMHDIPSWCRIFGHQVLKTEQQDGEIVIVLQVNK